MPTELQQDSSQAIFVILWPVLQQWMTHSSWRIFDWIRPDSSCRLKIALSAFAATLSTVGFHWNHTAYALLTGGIVSFTIPPLSAIGHAIGAWVAQHHIYQVAIRAPQQNAMMIQLEQKLLSLAEEHLAVAKAAAKP
jgi:hypothetical protein